MKRLLATLVLSVVWGTLTPAQAADWWKVWKVSKYVTVGANVADAHSGWNRPEANPLFGERFGGRGVAIKAGVMTAWLIAQNRMNRNREHSKPFAIANFAMAGTIGAVAVRNYRLPR